MSERGSMSVVVAGVIGMVLTIGWGLALVGSASLAAHRARSAADLAALAAATAARDGGTGAACPAGQRIARANGAVVARCSVADGGVVTVAVTVPVGLVAPGLGQDDARATARAGPDRQVGS